MRQAQTIRFIGGEIRLITIQIQHLNMLVPQSMTRVFVLGVIPLALFSLDFLGVHSLAID
jgi:hypothetical protein